MKSMSISVDWHSSTKDRSVNFYFIHTNLHFSKEKEMNKKAI